VTVERASRVRILYLYAEVMGYTMASIRQLVLAGAEVHVVHWDHRKLTPYQVARVPGVHMYPRSRNSVQSLLAIAVAVAPDITVVSGWEDKGYLSVARALRDGGHVVVSGFDDQWHGTLKQHLAAGLGKIGAFYRYFSHAWVTGVYQYEYARKLGFRRQDIIFDLYSADLDLFQTAYRENALSKARSYPHRFLFVGRLEPEKGVGILLSAWDALTEARGDWDLHLIGNGSLKDRLVARPGIVVKDFLQPASLVGEIANAGCIILPSCGEPWGVVVHEFAAAGLPLILSDAVGSATAFLVPGLNGFSFPVNDSRCLAKHMAEIVKTSDEALTSMGEASHALSNRITPTSSAMNLLSIVRNG
jgi:glycosyltransferase involved in cell wall biosynthesis